MATLELPYEKVYDLLHKCCTSISPDVLYLMKRAAAKETNPEAKTFLETMLKNVELAGQMDKLAMVCGLGGQMLTPTHMCLTISLDYFKGDFFKTVGLCAICEALLLAAYGISVWLFPIH